MGKKTSVNRKNTPIEFVKIELVKDKFGDRVETPVSQFNCWSEYFSQSLTAKTSTIGTVYEDTVFFNIDEHYRKQVDPSFKIQFDGYLHDIVDMDYRPTEHDIRITAKVVK